MSTSNKTGKELDLNYTPSLNDIHVQANEPSGDTSTLCQRDKQSDPSASNNQMCEAVSTPSQQQNEEKIKEHLEELEKDYRRIGDKFAETLENVPLDALQRYAANLPLSVRRHYEELKTTPLSVMTENARTVSHFFGVLNNCSNFLSPALLGDAIYKYGDKEEKSLMDSYNIKLEEFQKTTRLGDFVGVWEGVTPEGYEEIKLVLKNDWEEKSLKDIAPPKRSWLLKKVSWGSLVVVFAVPDQKELEEEDVREFLHSCMAIVFVNGQCVFNFEKTSAQTTPQESEAVQLTETSILLPEFRFSSLFHGKNVILSEDGLEARRKDVRYGGAGVYIDNPLRGTVEFEVEVTDHESSVWGSLAIGIGQYARGSYRHFDIPHSTKYVNSMCVWRDGCVCNKLSGKYIEESYGSVNLRDLKQGDRVGFRLLKNGELYFFYNKINQGLAVTDVYSEDKDVCAAVDVSGSCTALRITRAEMSGNEHPTEVFKGQRSSDAIQFRFHPTAGMNIMLLEDDLYAYRMNANSTSDNAVVYGSQAISYGSKFTFEVVITECGSVKINKHPLHRDGPNRMESIRVGVMRRPVGSLWSQSDIPRWTENAKNHCMWVGNKLAPMNRRFYDNTTNYGSVNLDVLEQGDRVGLRLTSNGSLSFFVNGVNQGVAVRDLHQEGFDIYPIVDVCARCYAVRITRAEIHSNEMQDLQKLCIEKIANCLESGSSEHVNFLPLPQRLKKQIQRCIEYL